jgi:NADH pyrophosphatase NudC (nudix superfamily)
MTIIPEFGIHRENEERRDGGVGIVYDPETKKFAVGRQTTDGLFRLFSGGVEAGEDIEKGTLREVVEESGLCDFLRVEKLAEAMTHYHNNLRNVNRVAHATCFLIILKSTKLQSVELEAHEKFVLEWATAEEILSNWDERNTNHDFDHWIYFMNKALERI